MDTEQIQTVSGNQYGTLLSSRALEEHIQEMIVQGKSSHEIARAAREMGQLRTLKEDATEKVKRGVTTLEEAMGAVMY